jgi:GPH family glycoside/pentoside/hexuronide:cation symporter
MVALYLMYFYTDVLGLSPADAGLLFLIASTWDAISDPIMGWLTDKTRTRYGRFRPYLLFATPPFAASFVALFYAPGFEGQGLFFWALAAHIVFRTCYTAVYIPYTALIARLSSDADERASIAGVKSAAISLGSLTVSFFALPAITALGGADEAKGFLQFALLCACGAITALWLCFAFTRERVDAEASASKTFPLRDIPRALIHNVPFLLIFLGVITFTGCYTILNKSVVYIFKYDIGNRDAARWAISAIAVAGILSPLAWVRITHTTSKRTTWILGCVIACVGLLIIYFSGTNDIATLTFFFFVTGCGIHGVLMTFFAMAADTVDYGEWRDDRRLEASLFGLISFANKVSLDVGTWLLGVLLTAVGFEANVDQSQQTLTGLRQIMALAPIVGFAASAAIIWFFPFNTQQHRDMVAELARRKAKDA